ncbi:hypothetical protein HMPREF3170_01595 [Corynebacterium sp. HMSC08D02]|nr:hypothetical protein HMPREF3170_01595 [Corynebacterium sp. HMSC08D02]
MAWVMLEAMSTHNITIAVNDAALHPEAMHLAAATGMPVTDLSSAEPAEVARRCEQAFAILIDAHFATHLPPAVLRRPNCFELGQQRGAYDVPDQSGQLLRALGALRTPKERGRVIGVVGASGGVGASTFAAACARAAAPSTLVDGHAHSGGLDLLLGIEEEIGARWGEIAIGEGAVAREDVRRALPVTPDGVAVMTCSREVSGAGLGDDADELEALVEVLGTGGVTVVDAPCAQLPARCDVVAILVAPQVRAVSAAAQLVAQCERAGLRHVLVVRDIGWAGIGVDEIAAIAGSRVVATIGQVRGLTKRVEQRGLPSRLPAGLAKAAKAVLEEVA